MDGLVDTLGTANHTYSIPRLDWFITHETLLTSQPVTRMANENHTADVRLSGQASWEIPNIQSRVEPWRRRRTEQTMRPGQGQLVLCTHDPFIHPTIRSFDHSTIRHPSETWQEGETAARVVGNLGLQSLGSCCFWNEKI